MPSHVSHSHNPLETWSSPGIVRMGCVAWRMEGAPFSKSHVLFLLQTAQFGWQLEEEMRYKFGEWHKVAKICGVQQSLVLACQARV